MHKLHKPVVRKLEKRKVHSSFQNNIGGYELAHMQLISHLKKEFGFYFVFIDIFRKYAWVIPAKNKQGTTITNAIQKKLDRSKGKPSKIWVNKGSEFYNRSIKSWLEKNNIEMYSTLWKSVVAERFLRTLKTKIFLNLIKIFAKRYTPIWSEVVFVIRNIKTTLPWTHFISDFKGEEIVGNFYEKEL